MSDNTYNGWTNYETWVWKLWIDNDEGWYREVYAVAEECFSGPSPVSTLANYLESEVEGLAEQWMPDQTGPFADLLNAGISAINWHEIAKAYLDDVEINGSDYEEA